MAVMGVDACPQGWVGVILAGDGVPEPVFGRTITDVQARAKHVSVVAIDIPIGLPAEGRRAADVAVRKLLGPRWQSLFMTPIAEALTAETFAEANAISQVRTGSGISRQAYGLRAKILEVDAWATSAGVDVFEVHPELSFTMMAGRPMTYSKRRWAGFWERVAVLRENGIELPRDLREAGTHAATDDVLDAAAAAWSAVRLAAGAAISFPHRPNRDERGRAVAIWA